MPWSKEIQKEITVSNIFTPETGYKAIKKYIFRLLRLHNECLISQGKKAATFGTAKS